MIAAKKKAEEAPRGRKKGRIKQIENAPYLAKETVSEQARAKMIEARRRVEEVPPPRGRRRGRIRECEVAPETRVAIRLGKSSQSPTGNRRTCSLLTGAGIDNALRRTDRMDWKEARSDVQFIAGVEYGAFAARAFRISGATVVAWQEGATRVLCRLTASEEQEAQEAIRRGDGE
jgi:hypothetical protein